MAKDGKRKNKKGQQKPTASLILKYSKTFGQDAIDLYNRTGRTAQEWQERLMKAILSVNREGLWVHTKFGYSVPRRNGKNEIVAMRELYALTTDEHVLHTAHRTTTSHAAWERLCRLLEAAGYKEKEDYISTKQFGLEKIKMINGDGEVSFRTRSSKGGLGEGFDLLVIDEAQEYTADQETALKYVVTDSKNPQTLFCGTPPTAVSSGTVFMNMRDKALKGDTKNTGWAEWSVEELTDPNDKTAWYRTNPSLGTVFTERSVEDEVGADELDFNIQRLGYWVRYNLKSAISKAEWEALAVESLPELKSRLFVGIKYGKDGKNVAMSVAAKTGDGNVFVEAVDCRPIKAGNRWLIDFLKAADIAQVVVDGANGQQLLSDNMKAERLHPPTLPSVKEVITANALFEQLLTAEKISHKNQPSLAQSVTNCEKRAIGSNGGFGYKSIKDTADIALMDSAVFAIWAAFTAKDVKKRQKIGY